MKVIGITGGVAAGKSELARIFRTRGFPVIDADALAHACLAPGGSAHDAVVREFGTADRLTLRQKIFSSPELRKRLERILHPLIQAESQRLMEEYRRAGQALVFYEAALLVETSGYRKLDGLIVVRASESVRRSRLQARSPGAPVDAILQAQISDDAREKAATWIFDNDADRAALERQADDWILKYATRQAP